MEMTQEERDAAQAKYVALYEQEVERNSEHRSLIRDAIIHEREYRERMVAATESIATSLKALVEKK